MLSLSFFLGYLLTIIVGISIGLLGSGGSILFLPILVYSFNINPIEASTYCNLIIGITSAVASFSYLIKKNINLKYCIIFLSLSTFFTYIGKHYVMNLLPNDIWIINKNSLLMLMFATLMIVASLQISNNQNFVKLLNKKILYIKFILSASFVGLITGMLGAGAGFLIVPLFLSMLKLPMKEAIGSSLLIIAINSLSFLIYTPLANININNIVLICLALAILGMLIAIFFIGPKISPNNLKKFMKFIIFSLGIIIFASEIFNLLKILNT